jgi:thiosulfate/3-mercaptopyruvate sulfurtransferase
MKTKAQQIEFFEFLTITPLEITLDSTSGKCILSRKLKSIISLIILIHAINASPSIAFDMLIDAQQVANLQNVVLIDTRPTWRFLLGHIPGAVNPGNWKGFSKTVDGVPALNDDKTFIAERLREMGIDYNKTIIVYGDAKDPWRTDGRFFWMFHRFGFDQVGLLDGGWEAWLKTGNEIEKGPGKPRPSSLAPDDIKLNNEVITFQNKIKESLGSKSLAIIDNRTRKEFDGAILYGEKRGGHIPGAIHIDWKDFFNDSGWIKGRETLSALLSQYGVRKDQEVVVYCTGGVRSAMAYFVLRYLDYKVRNYDGSWWDWSHNLALPSEK